MSEFPGGRYLKDGDASGQAFRERHLVPAFEKFEIVHITLAGTAGYGSSFLEEAFGGLVRNHAFDASELRKRMKFTDTDGPYARYVSAIWEYVDQAQASNS
ncbi:MAG: STAS-like domain-containing protein [Geminicoccaceae bacterium]